MSKSWRHERMEKKPKREQPKLPRKVRYEDFVTTVDDGDLDEDEFPDYEEDVCLTYHSIRN